MTLAWDQQQAQSGGSHLQLTSPETTHFQEPQGLIQATTRLMATYLLSMQQQ